jgi:hypothetical protein
MASFSRSRGKARGRYERNVKSAPCWPELLFEALAQITKPPLSNPVAVSAF